MKLLRYGQTGSERPGAFDANGIGRRLFELSLNACRVQIKDPG